MDKHVLLCTDSRTKRASFPERPFGVNQDSSWLACETKAQECRSAACSCAHIDEVWVESCDDMEPINIAAAIKHDDPLKKVFLISDGQNGSLASRAANAGIDALWSRAVFEKRYARKRAEFASCLEAPVLSTRNEMPIEDDGLGSGLFEKDMVEERRRVEQYVPTIGVAHGAHGEDCEAPPASSLSAAKREKREDSSPVKGKGGIAHGANESRGSEPGDGEMLHKEDEAIFHPEKPSGLVASGACEEASGNVLDTRAIVSTEGGRGVSCSANAAPIVSTARSFKPVIRVAGAIGDSRVAESESAPHRVYKVAGAPVKEGAGTVIAVVSGSGGCGKSTLSTMLALVAARSGLRTAAFDADFQFGDLDYLLGISSPLRVEEVVEDPSRLANTTSSDQAPFLIAAPRRLEVSELVTSHAVSIASALKCAFDVVVVNTGSMWTDGHAGILEACDVVAFVTDSRPSSLRATVHAVELCARMGIATTGFTFVVNRHNKASLLSAVDVSCALRGSHAVELADGGRDVDELLGAGYPEELIESKNIFASGVRDLLIEMLPGHRSEVVKDGRRMPKRRRSLFGRGDGK